MEAITIDIVNRKELTEDDARQVACVDAISHMAYVNKVNIEYMDTVWRGLPKGSLKDTVIFFQENQKHWLNKITKSLKEYSVNGMELYPALKQDLDDMPLIAMFDIIGQLKSVHDMENVADIVTLISDIEDLTELKNIIKSYVGQNQKTNPDEEGSTQVAQ